MKKYTLAWLALMAIKRLDKVKFYSRSDTESNNKYARSLVDWFMNYRDFAIEGSWYPNEVFDDQDTSHVVKYAPIDKPEEVPFADDEEEDDKEKQKEHYPYGALPVSMEVAKLMNKQSSLYKEKYFIQVGGNLCDRCNAMYHTIVDNFKITFRGEKGNPISPSSNHMAMRFFMMSHYIADGHMPMHCDARPLQEIQDCIGSAWERDVRNSFKLDLDNQRFFYDRYGYPKKEQKVASLIRKVEEKLDKRVFYPGWGAENDNLYDYMKSVTHFSYLMSYEMFPADYHDMGWKEYTTTEVYMKHFEEYSSMILADAIDSIARAWLNDWKKYHEWSPAKKAEELEAQLAALNAKEIEDANNILEE